LEDLLKNVGKILSVRAHEKGLELEIDLQAVVALRGDPLRLQQILLNFGSNALKFTEQGKVTIAAHIISKTKETVQLRFSVRDTGLGIDADHVENIFDVFHQADASTTRRHGGSGLGLAICKRLVEMMGGDIGVQSQSGQGSEFYFTVELPTGSSRVVSMHNAKATAALQALTGVRLLLVEDNLLNQEVAKGILEHHGASVEVASDGEQALVLLSGKGAAYYDLVLMDLQMPGLDGFETTEAIRQMPSMAALPILAMTADTLIEHRQQCQAAGMNDFIAKPINVEQMLTTLLMWLDRRPLDS